VSEVLLPIGRQADVPILRFRAPAELVDRKKFRMARRKSGIEADVEDRKISDAAILQGSPKGDVVEGRVTLAIRLANSAVHRGIRHRQETTLRDQPCDAHRLQDVHRLLGFELMRQKPVVVIDLHSH